MVSFCGIQYQRGAGGGKSAWRCSAWANQLQCVQMKQEEDKALT